MSLQITMSDPESSDPEDMVASDDEEVPPATSFDIEIQVTRIFEFDRYFLNIVTLR